MAKRVNLTSRKFVLALLSLLAVTAVTVGTAWIKELAAVLPTFIGGVLGVLSAYYTGNVAAAHVAAKAEAAKATVPTEAKKEDTSKDKTVEKGS